MWHWHFFFFFSKTAISWNVKFFSPKGLMDNTGKPIQFEPNARVEIAQEKPQFPEQTNSERMGTTIKQQMQQR